MINNYNQYIKENLKQSRKIYNLKMQEYDKLSNLLERDPNYMGKFTEWLFSGASYKDLETTYDDIKHLKSLNISIDINPLSYEKTVDKIIDEYNDHKVRQLLKEFPSTQKKLIRDNMNKNIKRLMIVLSESDKRGLFISKISRYKDFNSLKKAMERFGKSDNIGYEKVKSLIESGKINTRILHEDNNYLIVLVNDSSEINIIGSDTSWCIVNNTSMWKYYNENRHQLVIFDKNLPYFDINSKIGVTLEKNGRTYAAYNISDESSKDRVKEIFYEIGINKIINKFKEKIGEETAVQVDNILDKNVSKMTYKDANYLIEDGRKESLDKLFKFILRKIDYTERMAVNYTSHFYDMINNLLTKLVDGRDYILESTLRDMCPDRIVECFNFGNVYGNDFDVIEDVRRKFKTNVKFARSMDKQLDIFTDKEIYQGYLNNHYTEISSVSKNDINLSKKIITRLEHVIKKFPVQNIKDKIYPDYALIYLRVNGESKTKKMIENNKEIKLSLHTYNDKYGSILNKLDIKFSIDEIDKSGKKTINIDNIEYLDDESKKEHINIFWRQFHLSKYSMDEISNIKKLLEELSSVTFIINSQHRKYENIKRFIKGILDIKLNKDHLVQYRRGELNGSEFKSEDGKVTIKIV